MTFQIKDFVSITASMINYMRATQKVVTDFNVGGVSRSLLEAPAAELDALYQQMLSGLQAAIPVAVFNSFDFPPLAAQPASNMVRVSIAVNDAAVAIPANTRFTREDGAVTYLSASDATITAGNTFADVRIVAEIAGTAGNTPAGTGFTLSPSPTGFVSALALADFQNGTDAETAEDQKSRFNAFIVSLARGTNAALRYGLSTVNLKDAAGNIVERVAFANIVEPYLTDVNAPIAYVEIYVHNGVGGTSSGLVARALEVLTGYYESGIAVPGWKAAGVKILVQAAPEQAVNVAGTIWTKEGFDFDDVEPAVQASLSNYIAGLNVGTEVQAAEIITLAKRVTGVHDYKPAAPLTNVAVPANVKPMPGTFTLVPPPIVLSPQSIGGSTVFGLATVTA